jgi:DnaK suppressor protein
MQSVVENAGAQRRIALRNLLTRARSFEFARVLEPSASGPTEMEVDPRDEMDVAREQEQMETEAHLKEHRWATLSAIDAAFVRLHLGQYGLCKECGDEISLERLKAVPFASHCIDCQQKSESKAEAEDYTTQSFSPAAIELGASDIADSHSTGSAHTTLRPSPKSRHGKRVGRAFAIRKPR